MFLNEKIIDQFLCHERNLNLSMKFDEYYIFIVPEKAHFLVTVEYHSNIIYQDFFNTWEQAFCKFESLCNKYLVQTVCELQKE